MLSREKAMLNLLKYENDIYAIIDMTLLLTVYL